MRSRPIALACALAVLPARSGEFRAGAGVFFLARDGVDLLVSYRPDRSAWVFGYRHVQWTDVSRDPFTDRRLSDTRETRTGPLVQWLFRPEQRGSWYLAGSLYRWTKREHSEFGGDTNQAATTAPSLGGGYTHMVGRGLFWNAGMLLSPGARLHTRTSTGSEDDSGAFDILIQMGFRF